MDKVQKTRLGWKNYMRKLQDAGVVCRKYGISSSTLRKWLQRHKDQGICGLKELTPRPLNSLKKVIIEQEEIILSLRNDHKLGIRRIQSEIKRLHDIAASSLAKEYRWRSAK